MKSKTSFPPESECGTHVDDLFVLFNRSGARLKQLV